MKKLLDTIFNHERYQAIAIIITTVFVVWFWGCESKVRSIAVPDKMVTRAELGIEIKTMLATIDLRKSQLDKQDMLRRQILQTMMVATETGGLNPAGLLPLALSVLGVGAVVDNSRKRTEIKKLSGQ